MHSHLRVVNRSHCKGECAYMIAAIKIFVGAS
jgi:hypothetical protein